jgi:hypothetical protein
MKLSERVHGPIAFQKEMGAFREPQRAAGILPTEEAEKITADGTSAALWRRRVN